MQGPVLVAYATRSGSTAEVATAVGKELGARGLAVEVRSMVDVAKSRDLGRYGAVVVGSAIRAGKWMPEALAFLDANRDALGRVPVAGFVVCGFARDVATSPKTAALVAGYTALLRQRLPGVAPVAEVAFAGAIDPAKLGLPIRALLKLMKAPAGDWRDWPAIRAWAADLGEKLAA